MKITTILSGPYQGADIDLVCYAGDGIFYCKNDKYKRDIRATEWLCTSLCEHLHIPVPDFAVIEHPETGVLYFGSRNLCSTAGMFEVNDFLQKAWIDEIGRRSEWLAPYLSRLYVFDLFVANPDRQKSNFLLAPSGGNRTLFAMDFASADISKFETTNFPIASTQTLTVGRLLRLRQGFCQDSALEMIDLIAAIPASVIASFLANMPQEWLAKERKSGISELWSNGRIRGRLEALRKGIVDGSLL